MKKSAIIVAIGAAIALPTASQAIQLTDYTIPTSEWQESFLEGSGNLNSGNQDQASYDLYLKGDYTHNYTSLPQNWEVELDGYLDIDRGGNEGDKRDEAYGANASATIDNYFNNNDKMFWYGSADAKYRDWADDMQLNVGAGLGYGRVINATPLAEALRVVEELREHGVITGNLSDATYIEMAQVIDRESEFQSKYGLEEYEAYWYKAIEDVLNQAGVLSNNALGAEGALHMRRVLEEEYVTPRSHGWVVRAGLGYMIQDFYGEDSDPSLNAEFKYALPIGLQGQFTNVFTYSTIFADDTNHSFANTMTYSHEVSDQIDWENEWFIGHEISGDDNAEDTTQNLLTSTLSYYLTNRMTAGLTVSAEYLDDGIDDNGNDDWDFGTYFSIRYRLK
jgi:hypothetical protein